MKENTSKVVYTFYICPKCLNPSLLNVDSNLYRCLTCNSSESVPEHQQNSSEKVSLVSMLVMALFMLLIFL